MNLYRNELPLKEEINYRLEAKFGRQVEIFSLDSMGGGCINHASKMETSEGVFFLKWNADCPADMFQREAEGLGELKKAAGDFMTIPEVFAVKEVNDSPGFLVLEYLEQGYYLKDSDEMLGRGLAAIHQFKGQDFGFHHNNYCGATLQDNGWEKSWIKFFGNNRLGFLLELIQRDKPLPAGEMKIYNQLLERLPLLIPDSSEPSLIHGDLWSGNYMITAKGPALIDPASYYAEREMEMGIMTLFGGFSQRFYNAYNDLYPLSPDWKERNELYQLYHVLNHYYLFGGSYRSQALQIARRYL